MKLFKTVAVIWSEFDPTDMELSDLARDAEVGDSYCSKTESTLVDNAESDPDWDGTEFFFSPDEEEE
jgi:hypothetical protein